MAKRTETKTKISMVVDGVEYPLDIYNMTGREIGTLKRVGHVLGFDDIATAMTHQDTQVLCALAGIAIERTGVVPDYDKLLDMPMGMVQMKIEDVEEKSDADPLDEKKPKKKDSPGKTGSQN